MVYVIPELKGRARSILLLLLLSVSPTSGADTVRIEVRSSWTGLSGRTQSTMVIAGNDSKYSANGQPVAAQAVQSLFRALEEPPIEKPSLENCEIDARWLNANLELAQREFQPLRFTPVTPQPPGLALPDTTPQQFSLFRSHFTDVTYVRQAFERDFKDEHSDDYPEMSVEVLRDGRRVLVHSASQHVFMLPWVVDGNTKRTTFNCHISRSIANLLPSTFVNRKRLLPDYARRAITDEIEARMQHMWDTEETLGPDLAPIRAHFTIVDSDVACHPWVDAVDGDNCLTWNADLKAQNLPAQVRLDVSLIYKNGRLVGVGEFLARIENYVALVRSIPWLVEFMSQQRKNEVKLLYGPEWSLGRRSVMSDLGKELREHQKNQLADRLIAEYDRCALLQVEGSAGRWSRWVVFPNREMLLWKFEGDSALKWKAAQLDGWECDALMRCTGVVIQPNGTLAPP